MYERNLQQMCSILECQLWQEIYNCVFSNSGVDKMCYLCFFSADEKVSHIFKNAKNMLRYNINVM